MFTLKSEETKILKAHPPPSTFPSTPTHINLTFSFAEKKEKWKKPFQRL